MIKTETCSTDTIGYDDYKELSPGVHQNDRGAVVIDDGLKNAVKIEFDTAGKFKE